MTKIAHNIYMERGLLNKIPQLLRQKTWGERYAVIADTNIGRLYGKDLVRNLKKAGLGSILITFPAGEKSKSLIMAGKLLSAMLMRKISRKDAVIALGGGVTGDLAGFVASIYMRGVVLIHIPTTLLSMVDSSIGGKTGVDLPEGKNLAGTFYQPKTVYIDPEILLNLSKSELLNGFAEVIKYGIIKDYKLFCLLEAKVTSLLKPDLSILNKIIIRCCKIKASIIAKDERANNIRMILNYGHTVGHAIEQLSSYKISHGRAIVMGMKIINKICENKRLLNKNEVRRINNVFTAYKFIDNFSTMFSQKSDQQKLWQIMQHDKKVQKGKIHFIIAKTIGKADIYDKITKEDFFAAFKND